MVEIYRNFDLTYASVDLQGDSVKAARRGHITRCSGVTSQKQSSAIFFFCDSATQRGSWPPHS